VNWAPRSDVMTAGDPKSAHPPLKKQSIRAIYSYGGGKVWVASGQQEVLSMIVKRWVKPFDAGKGPNRSTWMRLKRSKGTTWRWILARLQCSRPGGDIIGESLIFVALGDGQILSGDFVPKCRGFGEGPCP
jgi:hypothetical protein